MSHILIMIADFFENMAETLLWMTKVGIAFMLMAVATQAPIVERYGWYTIGGLFVGGILCALISGGLIAGAMLADPDLRDEVEKLIEEEEEGKL